MAQSPFGCSQCLMIQNLRIVYQGVAVSLSVRRLNGEDGQIEASLSYILRLSRGEDTRRRERQSFKNLFI